MKYLYVTLIHGSKVVTVALRKQRWLVLSSTDTFPGKLSADLHREHVNRRHLYKTMLWARLLDYLHADTTPDEWSCLQERADNERSRYIANNERHTGLLQGEIARKLPYVSSIVKGIVCQENCTLLRSCVEIRLERDSSEYFMERRMKGLREFSFPYFSLFFLLIEKVIRYIFSFSSFLFLLREK